MKYRAEIDGLRALAVVPVILFHAGFELFSGGFVGVDVFFVISGYLITTILIEDLENQRFSLVNFYERRARRILPALFFVMFVCIPFAWLWMLPSQMKDFSQSLVAVSLFASNILFWIESGYFDAAAEEKPLLHTWSLAVEEQYYVLFPIFLFLAWRYGKNRVFWMIVVMASFSLLLSEWGWRNKADANFYLAPTRAWELFAGSIAAFIVHKNGVRKSNFLALLGLAAIIFSIFAYDESTPFPSVYALVPVLGVVLLVLYADKETIVAKLLSTRSVVGLGLISYSAYLWHQPLLAFSRIYHNNKLNIYGLGMPNPETSTIILLAIIIITFALAYFTFRYIEGPFRKSKESNTKLSLKWYLWSSIGLLFFILLGLYGHVNYTHFKVNNVQLSTSWGDDVRQYDCLLQSPEQDLHASECFSNSHDVVLWGDSHAASLSPGMRVRLGNSNLGFTQLTQSGCGPLANLEKLKHRSNCNTVNDSVFTKIVDAEFKNVVLHGAWLHGDYPLNLNDIISHLDPIVKKIKNEIIGVNIVIVGAVPRWRHDPRYHIVTNKSENFLFSDSAFLLAELNETLRVYSLENNILFIDPTQTFCPNYEDNRECILGLRGNVSEGWIGVTTDYGHLSTEASLLLANTVIPFLVPRENQLRQINNQALQNE
ncbi:acyltransferase [Planktomarina temperata]|nr:acyltransferase [Planktomarina temperata]